MSKYKFIETVGMKKTKRRFGPSSKFSHFHTVDETRDEIWRWLNLMFKNNNIDIGGFTIAYRPNVNKCSILWDEKTIVIDTQFK